ncbi:formate/nitrite transporter family protein [Rubrivirga sp. S365]|uniref:Formate/nitrite transporter family protein n=1 Tax=Rubrivirga litoralis TaxID=3075598 RepID=A0ABU3BNJ4_9BACT|nr:MULTISPECIES: formate/nitrite transporter family protein [unclassified Rubrivirga]MDT0630859.1 formate/nitrite transporter family protein [Rubrivirga sp. F394]MDT7857411.1 formate/nitrite transporter family protein [Rubrivirga sp. S365]
MATPFSRARRALLDPPAPPAEGLDADGVRSTLDRAESGAPAAGHAVRDLFSTDEIFQRVLATADEEFVRSTRLLFFSGLAAGLSIGLSFVARSSMSAAVGDADSLVGSVLYPVGFLLIVLGRYQLFTENTLTPVTLVLTKIASVPQLLRVWGVVLVANVLGAALVGLVLARSGVLDADTMVVAREIASHGLHVPTVALFWKGLFAGWLVASMVWLNHAARDSITRFFIVFVIMFLVPAADLFHCIIGACEALFLVFQGEAGLLEAGRFFGAVVVGNTAGGVLLVALLNYSQTRQQRFPYHDPDALELTWREWMFGVGRGKEAKEAASQNAPLTRDESVAETGSMLDRPVSAEADDEAAEDGRGSA